MSKNELIFLSSVYSILIIIGWMLYPEGGAQTLVLYTCMTREMRRKGFFFTLDLDSQKLQLGLKTCFKNMLKTRRVLFEFYWGI